MCGNECNLRHLIMFVYKRNCGMREVYEQAVDWASQQQKRFLHSIVMWDGIWYRKRMKRIFPSEKNLKSSSMVNYDS